VVARHVLFAGLVAVLAPIQVQVLVRGNAFLGYIDLYGTAGVKYFGLLAGILPRDGIEVLFFAQKDVIVALDFCPGNLFDLKQVGRQCPHLRQLVLLVKGLSCATFFLVRLRIVPHQLMKDRLKPSGCSSRYSCQSNSRVTPTRRNSLSQYSICCSKTVKRVLEWPPSDA